MSSFALPPPLLPGEEANSSAALASLAKKRHFLARLRFKPVRHEQHTEDPSEAGHQVQASEDGVGPSPENFVAAKAKADQEPGDVYEWATVYENQRGVTLFSTSYYSSASLLPFDPPSFTIPETKAASKARKEHPSHEPKNLVNLEAYTLPDPEWRWVSKWWMVDMRCDGEVQYDGFEYNWSFRSKSWRARVGPLSAGGFVRRRRWVRLMMCPSQSSSQSVISHSSPTSTSPTSSQPSLHADDGDPRIWRGDIRDWSRCVWAMKTLARDGRKLEVWKGWLDIQQRMEKGKRKQWTEDDDTISHHQTVLLLPDFGHGPSIDIAPPPIEWIVSVLETHGSDVLQLFIYPDSRAQFLDLITEAGLRDRLSEQLFTRREFWVRSEKFDKALSPLLEHNQEAKEAHPS